MKPPRITREDISTLETIYADGRALGGVINQLKYDLARVLAENAGLRTEVRTLRHRLHLLDIQQRLAGYHPVHGPGRGAKRCT